MTTTADLLEQIEELQREIDEKDNLISALQSQLEDKDEEIEDLQAEILDLNIRR